MSDWKDISSYSQSDRERAPKSFEINLSGVRLVVTRKHHMEGWYADCPPFFSFFYLGDEDADAAKNKALATLNTLLLRTQESVLVAQRKAGKEE